MCRQHPYSCTVLGKSLNRGLGSKTVLNTGSRRPTWGLGGSGGPGPRSTAQPEYQGAAAPAAGGRGSGLAGRINLPRRVARSASPHLVTPSAFAPVARPRASPRHSPRPAPRHRRARRCVRCADSLRARHGLRARPRITCAVPFHSVTSTPSLSRLLQSRGGRVPVAPPRDEEHGTWLLVRGP